MNIGTTGSMPKSVLDNYDRYNRLVAERPWDMGGEWGDWPYTADLVEAIASSFGAEPFELILSRNTTDGMCTVLGGLNFANGGTILTTHHEHIAALSPLQVLKERYKVKVVELEIPVFPTSEQEFVDVFRQGIKDNPETRLITFSHITYKTGTLLPARKICQLANAWQIPTLIDGAHTIGMIELDFHDIDCDFYAGSGHKWQCGAGATGILYVRDNNAWLREYWADLHNVNVFWPINSSLYFPGLPLAWQLQYIGHDNYPAKRALKDSCAMWDDIGRDRIENYVLDLSHYCKKRIKKTFGNDVLMFSPDIRKLSSGLTSFNPFETTTGDEGKTIAEDFVDRLRDEYGYVIRSTNFKIEKTDTYNTYAFRISTHLFHDRDQIDGLVDAMYDLFDKMNGGV